MPYHHSHPDSHIFTPDDPAIKTPLESFYDTLIDIKDNRKLALQSFVTQTKHFPTIRMIHHLHPTDEEVVEQVIDTRMISPENFGPYTGVMDVLHVGTRIQKLYKDDAGSLDTKESITIRRYARGGAHTPTFSSFVLSVFRKQEQTEIKKELGKTTTETVGKNSHIDVTASETVAGFFEEAVGKITLLLDQEAL